MPAANCFFLKQIKRAGVRRRIKKQHYGPTLGEYDKLEWPSPEKKKIFSSHGNISFCFLCFTVGFPACAFVTSAED